MGLITYETIRVAHRAEKEEQLQSLPENFFKDVSSWLSAKESQKNTESLLELENAKKILEDIIDRREKKIVLAAIRTVRGNVPPSNLTEDERKFFDEIVNILKAFKDKIKDKLIDYEIEKNIEDAGKTIEQLKNSNKINIKFLSTVPKEFVDINNEHYGPYNTGDVAQIPADIANLLITKKVAEKVM